MLHRGASRIIRSKTNGLVYGPRLMPAALAVLLLVAHAAFAQRPYGVDVSYWEPGLIPAQWVQMYESGYVFCFTKATDGTSVTDYTFVDNMTNARAAGIYIGGFHVNHPATYTATAEANYFVSVAGPYISEGYLRPVLDLEDGYTLGKTALSNWVNAWLNAVETQTGIEPLIYTNPNYAINYLNTTVADRDFWCAQYLTSPDPQNDNPTLGVFNSWAFWQYTDAGHVPGITYGVDLDVFNGNYTSLQAYVIPPAAQSPTIVQHPTNRTVTSGNTMVLTVIAEGGLPLTYQWQKNSANLTDGGHYSGCTLPVLTISSCDTNDAAAYRCVVTNNQGSATSNTAVLALTTQQTVYIVESRSGGKNYAYYSEPTGSWSSSSAKSIIEGITSGIGSRLCFIGSSGGTALFRFTPALTGSYRVYTTNCSTTNSGNPLVHKVAHAGGTSNIDVCQNTTCTVNAVNKWLPLGDYTLNSGTQYSVTMDCSTSAGSGPNGYVGRTDAIKWELLYSGQLTITQQPVSQSVCTGSPATFTVAAAGTGTLSYQWQKNSTNITNGGHYSGCTTTTLTVSNTNSSDVANYRCVVTDSTGNVTSNQAALSLKTATAITQHPSNQTLGAGDTATFSVSATGDGTLSYQWQKNSANITNGSRVSGATSATLQITSLITSDAGNYRCVVTGNCGSATSNTATLTVMPAGQPGDFDDDTDVDLVDFGHIQQCLGISSPFGDTGCGPADLNGDSIIDGQDLALFRGCMSGSHIQANPGCGGGS